MLFLPLHIVAPRSFTTRGASRDVYKPDWLKGSGARAGSANRYAAPFPPAVLRSARRRCSCSCGRSCGSSGGDAFCGRSGRYAVMRVVAERATPSPPIQPLALPSSLFLPHFLLLPLGKYLEVYDTATHRKYRRHLFINAPRRAMTRVRGQEYRGRRNLRGLEINQSRPSARSGWG